MFTHPALAACVTALLLTLALPSFSLAQGVQDILTRQELENGLDVIVLEDHSVPIVTIEVVVKNGAYTEPPELNGLSHLYEHMFFKGNAVIPTQSEYLKRMRELGIVFNGTTSTERVNYFFTLPAKNLEAGLEFMRDAIVTPKFDQKEFQNEIQVVIGEVDRNESSHYYWLRQAVDQRLWYKYPTRKDSLGDRKTITTATIKKMKTMQQRYYVPNNAALFVAGDVDPARALALVKDLYGGWKSSGKNPHTLYPVPAHPPLQASQGVLVTRPVQTPMLSLNWHGPSVPIDPKATFAADVLSYILAQPTSTFYKRLVESGITLGAGIGYSTQAHVGPIGASAQVLPGKIKPAFEAIVAELGRLVDPTYFSDEQLANAKKMLAIEAIYDQEKTSSLVHTLSYWWASADLEYYLNYIQNLEAVTREDIARYVTTYLVGKPYVLGVLASEEAATQEGLTDAALTQMALSSPVTPPGAPTP